MVKNTTITYRMLLLTFTWFWSLFVIGLYNELVMPVSIVGIIVYFVTIFLIERYRLKYLEEEV